MNVLAATSYSAGQAILGFILIIGGFFAYWVPSIVAGKRRVPNIGTVVIVNMFLGWTLIGWIIALAMAMRGPAPVTR